MTSAKPVLCTWLLFSAFLILQCIAASAQADSNTPTQDLRFGKFVVRGDSAMSVNPSLAAEYYLKASELLQNNSDALLRARILEKLGRTRFLMGAYPEALSRMKEALEIYEKFGNDSTRAHLMSSIGSAYYFSDLKEQDTALAYFSRAREIYRKLGLYAEAKFNANYSAYIYWAKGQKQKALNIHKDALAVFDSINDSLGRAVSTSDIGFTLNSLGRYKEALNYNLKALTLARQLSDSLIVVPILNNIAVSYQNSGQLQLAADYSIKSMEMAKSRELLPRIKEALATLHKTYSLMGDYELAYKTHIQLKAISDSISSNSQLKKLLQFENQRAFTKKQNQLKIEQAKKDALMQARLKEEVNFRNNLIVLVILLLFLSVLILWNIRLKSRSAQVLALKNDELEASNKKIEEQNHDLRLHQKAVEIKNLELEQLLQDLKEAQAKLVQYEKLDALGVVVTGVAHEINNPLNFIQGGIYGLKNQLPALEAEEEEVVQTLLGHMQTGVERITDIVSQLNTFSINSIKKDYVRCDVHDILLRCIAVLKPKIAEQQCEVVTNFTDESLIISAHEGSLHQVFSNLILNGILAVDGDGRVEVTTRKLVDNSIEIDIRDDGVGIEPGVMKKVFDPFFTTREAGKGTGLGLFISYKLINSHHGTIKLQSQPGEGTVATVNLPNRLVK